MANPNGVVAQTAAAQQAFASDPKYKKYTQQVEKCLNSFDNVHEWADCIAFLKQLLKVRVKFIIRNSKAQIASGIDFPILYAI